MNRDLQSAQRPTVETVFVTVIVTHFNYSNHVGEALKSIVDQTHHNLECIVVDDKSSPSHVEKLRAVVKELNDNRIRVIELPENRGQTHAVFVALEESKGEFVSLLDPDDLYDPKFVEKMLLCHLNPLIYAPVASCEMGLFRQGGQCITRSYVGFKRSTLEAGELPKAEASLLDFGFSTYYPPARSGWLWGTTSSLMFRRDALRLLSREAFMPELKICADTYCVTGCHLLGGTLFLDEVLSWRGLHESNAVETDKHFSLFQNRHRPDFQDFSQKIKLSAVAAILDNGGLDNLKHSIFAQTLHSHFNRNELRSLFESRLPAALDLFVAPPVSASPQTQSPASAQDVILSKLLR